MRRGRGRREREGGREKEEREGGRGGGGRGEIWNAYGEVESTVHFVYMLSLLSPFTCTLL